MNKPGPFFKRLHCGGLFFNLYFGATFIRFSFSLTRDVLWYANPLRQGFVILVLSGLLWGTWLFRPWAELEETDG